MKRKRLVAIGGAIGGAICAVMALVHVPAVRAHFSGGCPWEKAPTAKELEDHRREVASKMRTPTRASGRPAFGFELDRTSKEGVLAWAKTEQRDCKEELGGAALRCEPSGATTAGAVRDAFFRFDPKGRLVALDLMHDGVAPDAAASLLTKLASDVKSAAGEPSSTHGTASADHLSAGYLSRAAFEFRFADYAADVSATNFGAQGVIVREQYRSLAEGS